MVVIFTFVVISIPYIQIYSMLRTTPKTDLLYSGSLSFSLLFYFYFFLLCIEKLFSTTDGCQKKKGRRKKVKKFTL
jgi:hypothetical protein